ncbi:MAG: hypothetical protein Q9168_005988 [Polycauliona sp. 1 TL-2023]
MEKASSSPRDEELERQIEFDIGEEVGIYTPAPSQAHRHVFIPISPSSDEALASKAPLLTTTEEDALNFVNNESLPLHAPAKTKRKLSRPKDDAPPELAKRPRTQPAHFAVAIDTRKAQFDGHGGKLSRPSAGLVGRKSSVPINKTDPFEIDSGNHQDKESSNDAPKEPKKRRGRSPNIKGVLTTLAANPQTEASNKPGVDAVPTARPLRALKLRSPESTVLDSKAKQQHPTRRNPRNGITESKPVKQLNGRQLRNRQPVTVSSSHTSRSPVDQSEVVRDLSAGQSSIVREGQHSSRGNALNNKQASRKTRKGVSGKSAPQSPQPGPGRDDEVLKTSLPSRALAQQHEEALEEGEGNSAGHANGSGDEEQSNEDEEDGESESNEQEHGEQEYAEQEHAEQEHAEQESDEQSSDIEGSEYASSHDSEIASDGPELELLGQHDAWRKIHEARREIGFSRKDGKKKIPLLETMKGKEIVKRIKNVALLYDSADPVASNVRLRRAFKKLDRCIQELSEDAGTDDNDRVVQALYAHAIPEFVLLLDNAFRAGRTQLSQKNSIGALEEIIELQEALIMLGEKASGWKARPPTSRPIVNPTRRILPLVKAMRRAFGTELEDRERQRRRRANRVNHAPEDDEGRVQRARETKQREDLAILQHIVDDCNRGSATQWGRKLAPRQQPATPPPPARTQPGGTLQVAVEGWSREEKRALLHELVERNEYYDLTELQLTWLNVAEEMFLKALNAPLLQNKLPEHIREGALFYKAAIEKDVEPHRLPKWVSCL